MKQGLSLKLSQQLALTPQLQQSIRLLQLSTLEMSQEIEQMLDENPFLAREEAEAEREHFGLDQTDTPVSQGEAAMDASLDGTLGAFSDAALATGHLAGTSAELPERTSDEPTHSDTLNALDSPNFEGDGTVEWTPADDSEWGSEAAGRGALPDDDSPQDWQPASTRLQDHLHSQAGTLRLSPVEAAALYFLIESLDDDGWLSEPIDDLVAPFAHQIAPASPPLTAADDPERHETLLSLLRSALGWLQSLEPEGVGARDLNECLRLQIEGLRNSPVTQTALRICQQPLEVWAKRDVRKLTSTCRSDEATVREALQLISRLEPKPGRRFADVQRQAMTPDVIVTRAGRGFKVQINPEVMPKLRIHEVYASALRGKGDKAEGGLPQRLQEARWFIKNIQQRFDTILRVSSAIVERQRNFFLHGELGMRPLVLRDIADELGLHESTISRVTTAKFMATPLGTYELKYFFGSGLGTESGANASSTAVRALLKQLIGAENPQKPLSDNQLAEMLKAQGIDCARRTVAKYREGMRIAPAHLRKTLPCKT